MGPFPLIERPLPPIVGGIAQPQSTLSPASRNPRSQPIEASQDSTLHKRRLPDPAETERQTRRDQQRPVGRELQRRDGFSRQLEIVTPQRADEPSLPFMAQLMAHEMGITGVVIGEAPAGDRHVDAYQQTIDRERYFTVDPGPFQLAA